MIGKHFVSYLLKPVNTDLTNKLIKIFSRS